MPHWMLRIIRCQFETLHFATYRTAGRVNELLSFLSGSRRGFGSHVAGDDTRRNRKPNAPTRATVKAF
jgi:hypothetical protein